MNILQLKNKYISDKTLVRLNSDEECLEMSDNIWPKVIYASNSWPVINEIHPIAYKNNACNMQCKKNNICDILNKVKPSKNGDYKELIKFVDDRPGHDFRYAIDSSKIQKNLGWKPKESFKSGIKQTVDWYIKNENWWKTIQEKKYKQERLGRIL